jgi:hypothetical protein
VRCPLWLINGTAWRENNLTTFGMSMVPHIRAITSCYYLYVSIGVVGMIGCAEGPSEHLHISGTVTYKGVPIPYGKIEFMPDTRQLNQVPVGYAVIMNGTFDTRKDGSAVTSGPQLVRIYGFEAEGGKVPVLEERVPLFDVYESHAEIKADQLEYSFAVPERKL